MDEVIGDISEVEISYSAIATKGGGKPDSRVYRNLWMGVNPDQVEFVRELKSWGESFTNLEYGKTYYWQIEGVLEGGGNLSFQKFDVFILRCPM